MPIEYELIRSKRKSVSIMVTADCRLLVRAPLYTSTDIIENFIKSKKGWIEKKINYAKRKDEVYSDIEYKEGGEFLFLGEKYKLKISDSVKGVGISDGFLYLPKKYEKNPQKHIKDFYMNESRKLLFERTEYFARLYNIKYSDIGVTGAKTKWGSCNSKGKIHYSFKLIFAPLKVIDYIAVHELCHIEFLNHSKGFWAKVESILPDYKITEKWLKENSKILRLM